MSLSGMRLPQYVALKIFDIVSVKLLLLHDCFDSNYITLFCSYLYKWF